MMKSLDILDSHDLEGAVVLLRVDFNVPVQNGQVSDYTRIQQSLPTISYLRECGAKIILISHFGRPKGIKDIKHSLKFLVPLLADFLKCEIIFSAEYLGQDIQDIVSGLNSGEIMLLENLRFYQGEEENSMQFAKGLAALADIYVNDAFSCSHREHASISAITHFLPSYAGFSFDAEISNLERFSLDKIQPSFLIVGGSKISGKFGILGALAQKVDKIAIGGAMANTFLKAQGYNIGNSRFEGSLLDEARRFVDLYQEKILLPVDVVCKSDTNKVSHKMIKEVGRLDVICDIGASSIYNICAVASVVKLALWGGPMGMFEDSRFATGSAFLARYLASATSSGQLVTLLGGGDTLSMIAAAGLEHGQFTYCSTGGGAFLKWFETGVLPCAGSV